jgi:LEA14-like dessication related protein
MMLRPVRWLSVLIIIAVLPACAGLGPAYEPPSVTLKSFRPLPTQGLVPDFEITLHVINPNAEPLKLRGVAYTISLDGHDLIKGVGNQLPEIEAYGEADLSLNASATLFSGIRLVRDLMSSPRDTIGYKVEAKLDTGAFRPAIRISGSGDIPMGKLRRSR